MANDSYNVEISPTFRAVLPLPPKKKPSRSIQIEYIPATPKPVLEAEKTASKLATLKFYRSPADQFSIHLTFRGPGNLKEILFPPFMDASMGGVGNHVREIDTSVDFHADSEEVQASSEAFQAGTEAFYAGSEEVQSSTEVFHASTEEARSSSEENHSGDEEFKARTDEFQASTEDAQHCQISNDCTWRGVEAENFYNTFNVFNAKPYVHKTRAPSYYAAAHQRSDVDPVPWWSESSFRANAGLVSSEEKPSAGALFDFRPAAAIQNSNE